jgi:hypothetical protein
MEMTMRPQTPTIRTIDLDHDQMMIFDEGRDGRVRVLHGAAWLTEERVPGDSIVPAGGEFRLGSRRTLVSAIGATRLQVVETLRSGPARWRAMLRRAARTAQRQVTRLQFGPVGAQLHN